MSKNNNFDPKYLKSPCSITEAVQISRGVAEDVVSEYQNRTMPLQVAVSIQLEILKEMVISSGIITEDEFRKRYEDKIKEFNRLQGLSEEDDTPKMEIIANDIEMKKE